MIAISDYFIINKGNKYFNLCIIKLKTNRQNVRYYICSDKILLIETGKFCHIQAYERDERMGPISIL